ncbi:Kinesin light chain 3 [Rhizoclosmatium hyalinum]|nr:Kinesin light chain 3 [Rhizoclosmatium hyalinum]
MTKASGLSLCAQLYLSPDPLLSSQVQDAKYFISHAWQYKFLDIVEALFHFAIQSNLNPETTIIWFDLFSNSQHNTAEKTFDWWQTVFMNAIKEIGNVVMVMQPWSDPIPLKRVWCLFEIYATAVTQSNFHVAMTVSEESKFLVKLMDDITSFQQIFSNVNILETQSFNLSDRDAIFDVIQKTVGFSKLDQLVFQKLTQWMGGTITKELLKHNDDKVVAFKLAHALGNFFALQGQVGGAVMILEEALKEAVRIYGMDDENTIKSKASLGSAYFKAGRFNDAEPLILECYQSRLSIYGPDHERTLTAMGNLATLYFSQKRYAEAEPLFLSDFEACKRLFGTDDVSTFKSMNNLGALYGKLNQVEEAESLLKDCLEQQARLVGRNHPDTLSTINNLGQLYVELDRGDEAIVLLLENFEGHKRTFGATHPTTVVALNTLAKAYSKLGRVEDAIRLTAQYRYETGQRFPF